MYRAMYYDKDGVPISLEEWAPLFEDEGYKRVGLWEGDKVRVSTVWLGLDHAWGRGAPLIFETMVFGAPDDFEDMACQRYHTLEEAQQGHNEMVQAIQGLIADMPTADEATKKCHNGDHM